MHRTFLALAASLAPAAALAHAGAPGAGGSLAAGLAHPLGGADHLLAMLAVGLWAAATGGRARWAMPAAFLAGMAVGAAAGQAGLVLPAVEPMILASVVLLGAASALALRLAPLPALAALALFGAAHGIAHGLEGPAEGAALYAAGFLAATALLHAAVIALATGLARAGQSRAHRLLGGATAAGGLALALA